MKTVDNEHKNVYIIGASWDYGDISEYVRKVSDGILFIPENGSENQKY